MDRYRIIEVKQSVFADNDAAAERLRGELDAQGLQGGEPALRAMAVQKFQFDLLVVEVAGKAVEVRFDADWRALAVDGRPAPDIDHRRPCRPVLQPGPAEIHPRLRQ